MHAWLNPPQCHRGQPAGHLLLFHLHQNVFAPLCASAHRRTLELSGEQLLGQLTQERAGHQKGHKFQSQLARWKCPAQSSWCRVCGDGRHATWSQRSKTHQRKPGGHYSTNPRTSRGANIIAGGHCGRLLFFFVFFLETFLLCSDTGDGGESTTIFNVFSGVRGPRRSETLLSNQAGRLYINVQSTYELWQWYMHTYFCSFPPIFSSSFSCYGLNRREIKQENNNEIEPKNQSTSKSFSQICCICTYSITWSIVVTLYSSHVNNQNHRHEYIYLTSKLEFINRFSFVLRICCWIRSIYGPIHAKVPALQRASQEHRPRIGRKEVRTSEYSVRKKQIDSFPQRTWLQDCIPFIKRRTHQSAFRRCQVAKNAKYHKLTNLPNGK